MWNASRFCVSSLRRGHANLLCIVPILVYVLPKQDKDWEQTSVFKDFDGFQNLKKLYYWLLNLFFYHVQLFILKVIISSIIVRWIQQ